jgi:hypothetical protein
VKNLNDLDLYRTFLPEIADKGDHTCGAFVFKKGNTPLRVIASAIDGWDHVSVSTPNRCPTWEEMEFIKRTFFKPDEVAYQLHVAEKEHINCHPHTLHIWRPWHAPIPLPPGEMV